MAPPTRTALPDGFSQYLDELGTHQLLSAEEEVDLAKRIAAGRAAATRAAAGDERWQAVVADGERARARLAACNLRLVVVMAKRYRLRGLPLRDLVQDGNLGLMRAVDRFDPAFGYRFSTYASWWIRQQLTRGRLHQTDRTLRLPESQARVLRRAHGVRRQLVAAGGHPSDEDVAAAVDVDVDHLQLLQRAEQPQASLDTPARGADAMPLADVLADDTAVTPIDVLAGAAISRDVRAALARLDEREARVLVARFGLDGHGVRTLASIGDEVGLSRERVRQLQARALRQLRADAETAALADYLHA